MTKTYTTIQGDMWDSIAKKLYGTEKAMNALLCANQRHADTVVFGSGVELVVPEYAAPKTELLPPWRR